MIAALLILAGCTLYFMTPAERQRSFRAALEIVRRMRTANETRPHHDAASEVVRARTPLVLATATLITLNAAIFAVLLLQSGAVGDPDTLVQLGGNFGPRTTNGEWWRLVTSMFVHAGMFRFIVNMAALAQLGLLLERVVGPIGFGLVYVTSGAVTSLINLSAHRVSVIVGAEGAVFGLFGLLIAVVIWGFIQRSTVSIRLTAIARVIPTAVVFAVFNVTSGEIEKTTALVALGVGGLTGLILARGIGLNKPSPRRIVITLATTVATTVICAVPLRGVADIRPELSRIIEIEERTAHEYEKAAGQFVLGAIKAEALARVIESSIVPTLRAARERLRGVDGVPPEQQPLAASAGEFLRLREEAWSARIGALRKGDMRRLRNADHLEWSALRAFQRIRNLDNE
jgi:rhomboid protease GluP